MIRHLEIRLTVFLLLLTGIYSNVYAQTTLTAGDIAFTGYNSNNNGTGVQNDFSFVILRSGGISSGTNIKFTDNGYKIAGTNALGTAEGTLSWNASTALAQFTQVYVKIEPNSGNSVLSLSTGSIDAGFSNFILSQAGDQILAYQGTAASPTFISGIHMNNDNAATASGWDNLASGTTLNQNRSDLPPGLTNGVNAIMGVVNPGTSGTEKDNGKYNCTSSNGTTLATMRNAINNVNYWSLQDVTLYLIPPPCNFVIGSSLYINVSSFTVKKENNAAGLYWTTQTEIDNAGFDIQRSPDGKTYHSIATLPSKAENGNSRSVLSYNYSDQSPFTDMNFYRLAEKDKNGNVVYSDVRTLNFDSQSGFNCYPNPVSTQLFVEYNTDKDETMSIRIADVMGKLVRTKFIELHKGFNQTVIDMTDISKGIYYISIINNSGAVHTSKVIKE